MTFTNTDIDTNLLYLLAQDIHLPDTRFVGIIPPANAPPQTSKTIYCSCTIADPGSNNISAEEGLGTVKIVEIWEYIGDSGDVGIPAIVEILETLRHFNNGDTPNGNSRYIRNHR